MVSNSQLIKILGVNKTSIVNRIINPLNECLDKYQINTDLRICHFLAQVIHESGCFYYFEEIASGVAYENRHDLGNIQPGDGVKFKGRGIIQITGRNNYTQLSKDLGQDFINYPKLLATDEWGIISAGWFWNSRNLNILADKDDITDISKRINGGLNGLSDRQIWLDKAKSVIISKTV